MNQNQSIIKDDTRGRCYLCGKYCRTERHHVFGGAFRKKSEYYRLTVHLCHWCHNEPPNGAHYNIAVAVYLKKIAQRAAMEHYGWTIEQFREKFGKNWM